jgi:hypothetical protein
LAAERGHEKVARLLVEKGASLYGSDNQGRNALDCAKNDDMRRLLETVRHEAVAAKQQQLQKQSTHKLVLRRSL